MRAFLYIIFLISLHLPYIIKAQSPSFTSITVKNGLSSNNINAILKDKKGYIWFATEDGLDRFDGLHHVIYRHQYDDPGSLSDNEILALHEDAQGNLWIGTGGGSLNLYDRAKNSFVNISTYKANTAYRNHVIKHICSDHLGNIWIAHLNGVSILNPKTYQITEFRYKGAPFTTSSLFVMEDSRQSIWIGTHTGLYQYDFSTGKSKHFSKDLANLDGINSDMITCIAEDKKGNIWIGSKDGGLNMKPLEKNSFINVVKGNTAWQPYSNNVIYSIAVNAQNELWIGTSNGLIILQPKTGKITPVMPNYRNVYTITNRAIQNIYIDREGIYWVGTFRGGVNKYDKNQNLFNLIPSNSFTTNDINAGAITSFADAGEDAIFIGRDGGGLSLFNITSKSFKYIPLRSRRENADNHLAILAMKKTSDGRLYIGTYLDGLFILDPVSGKYQQLLHGALSEDISSNEIFCIQEDHNGNIWVGTNGEGIDVLDKNNKVIARYTHNPKFPQDKPAAINQYIRDIVEDTKHNIWIATHGGGVAMLHPATGKIAVYNSENSNLPSNKIESILEDSKHNFWIGTYSGLALLNNAQKGFTVFSEKEGFQNNRICKILEDRNGMLWMSTNGGISSLNTTTKKISNYDHNYGVQHSNFVQGSGFKHQDGNLFFGGIDGLNFFNPGSLTQNKNVPPVVITDLRVSNTLVKPSEDGPIKEDISVAKEIALDYKQNFSLNFVGLNYTVPGQNQYAYKLEGFDQDWIDAGNVNSASYTNLDPGEYVFHVKASNNNGIWNDKGTSVKITVHPPLWRTSYAYLCYILIGAGAILYSRHKGIKKLKREFALEQEKIRTEQERKEAQRIHELDEMKIKFLTNLSHEFRTPISLILGPVESLLLKEKHRDALTQLQIVRRNGKRLLNLVNQLLDFRKMEEHELKLQVSKGELVSFCRDISDSFTDLSDRKKIQFSFYSNIGQLHSLFDHDKIERILFNLLSNAFKFTLPDGTIRLELLNSQENHSNDTRRWVVFKVIDSGIGIPSDKKEKIFERFFQNNTASAILNQGTGIGLSITKEFVTMLGGTINVESELSKGTTFTIQLPVEPICVPETITLPADESPAEPAEDTTEPPVEDKDNKEIDEAQSDKPSILIVEDNDDFRYYLKDHLAKRYKIFEATDGKEGWQKALAQHPQLILSDISMPHMDGVELCRKLKLDKRTNHIPVILLTALTGETNVLKGLKTGANDYITKPSSVEVLNEKISNTIALNNTLKKVYTKKIEFLKPEVNIESEDERLTRSMMTYLEENLNNSQLSVEELSRHLGMSRSSLYHKILELTGETPVEFIRSVKLEKAAALLEKSSMNIAQVAYSTGFSTPNYFAKAFKAKFNMLPSEYILKMRKQCVSELEKTENAT